MTGQTASIFDLPLFLPANSPRKLVLRVAEAVEEAKDELTEFIGLLCRRLATFVERYPDMRLPIAQLLEDVHADARPT